MKKLPLCLALAVSTTWLSSLQQSAQAMIVPATAVGAGSTQRAADIQAVQKALESKMLRDKLRSLGLSNVEIQSRLTKLSDAQVHQLASQIRAVHSAGDEVIYIGVVVVLVLLAIYLIRRL